MKILQPKVIIALTIVAVLFVLVSLAQEMNRRLQIQREVQKLEQEVQEMKKAVIELENLNQYFRTDAYQERLAREKLGYQAPGEQVVFVPEPETETESRERNRATEGEELPNPEKWWRLFFVDEA